jgi:hypothetical protein
LLDYQFEFILVLPAGLERRELCIVCQFGAADCAREALPILVIRRDDRNKLVDHLIHHLFRAVEAFEDSVRRHPWVAIADSLRLAAIHRVFENAFGNHSHRAFPLAHVDILALYIGSLPFSRDGTARRARQTPRARPRWGRRN